MLDFISLIMHTATAELNKLAFVIAPIFYHLLYLSLVAVLVGGVLLLVRRLWDNQISPFWKYLMWVCLLAALLMPLSIQSDFSLVGKTNLAQIQQISFRDQYDTARWQEHLASTQPQATPSTPTPALTQQLRQNTESLFLKSLIFDVALPLIWFFGLLLLTLGVLVSALRLRRQIRAATLPLPEPQYADLLASGARQLNIGTPPRLTCQSWVKIPALLGIFRPQILLPAYVDEITPASLEHILLHELAHYKRRDNWANALLIVLQTVYWFNPLIAFFFTRIRQDMELACDAYLLKRLDSEQHKQYSRSLVEVLAHYSRSNFTPKLLGMVDNQDNLTRRIKMIKMTAKFQSKRLLIAAASLVIIAAACLLLLTGGKNDIPEVVAFNDATGQVATLVPGSYNWDFGREQVAVDAISPQELLAHSADSKIGYQASNTLAVNGNQQITVSTKGQNQPFDLKKRTLFDAQGQVIALNTNLSNNANSISFPVDSLPAGDYVYSLVLEFPHGTVDYSFKAVSTGIPYNSVELFSAKTPYIGNASAVGQIVSNLPIEGLNGDGISLQTTTPPYGATVNYLTDNATLSHYRQTENQGIFSQHAAIIFSLIGNADLLTFHLEAETGQPLDLRYTREEMGQDLSTVARDLASFEQFLRNICAPDPKISGK